MEEETVMSLEERFGYMCAVVDRMLERIDEIEIEIQGLMRTDSNVLTYAGGIAKALSAVEKDVCFIKKHF